MSQALPLQREIDHAQTVDSDAFAFPLLSHLNGIIIAIPAFNEELAIGSVVIRSRLYGDSIIVVDDGSDDDTADVAGSAGAEVIRHRMNQGYGSAIRTCFEIAQQRDADVLVILDGDGQHNPDDIPRLLNTMQKTGADIVIGSRFIDQARDQKIPLYRIFGMKLLDLATTFSSGLKVSDSQSGFRAYSRNALEAIVLQQNGMGAGSEILMRAADNNLKIEEIGIKVQYGGGAVSSKGPIRHGLDVINSIIRLVALKYPLWIFGILGLVFLFAAAFLLLYTLQGDTTTRGFITLYAFGMFSFLGVGIFFILLVLNLWSIRDISKSATH